MPLRFLALFLLILLAYNHASAATLEEDKTALTILAYHRIGENHEPETNLQTERFQEQIAYLQRENFNIISLSTAFDSYETGNELPPKSIALTFEGGYKSALQNAIPLLLEKHLPFTIFYTADEADADTPDFLNWNDLKHLKQYKTVTLGILPATYKPLTTLSKTDTQRQLNKAKTLHREIFGEEPLYFSYAFGEYSTALKHIVQDYGFKAAFTLNTAAMYNGADVFTIPRFSMTEENGDLDHFKTIANTLPLPVTGLEPQDPFLTNPSPAIGFNLPKSLKEFAKDLQCYVSDQPNPSIEILSETRIELRLKAPLQEPRTHLNCIMPVISKEPGEETIKNWRQLGLLLLYPAAN